MTCDAALAVLEVRVHLDLPPALLPDDYVLLSVELGDLAVEDAGACDDARAFGDAWLRSGRTPLLRAGSSIVAESLNVMLNPAHGSAGAAIVGMRRFSFDERLRLG